LSSAIEGIHTTLIDLFTQPIDMERDSKETQLVFNYTRALESALQMMHDDGMPLGMRVMCKAHEILMSEGHGAKSSPGEFRKQSVRVGDLVPPPAQEIPALMSALEQYIHSSMASLPLIQSGLVHVQFETIHPFLDGNGRIGRLLIVLMLLESKLLQVPIVYPSYYFKKHHHDYYRMLDRVRTHGEFEQWIVFYLTAIRDSALDGHMRAQEIQILERDLKIRINKEVHSKRLQEAMVQALDYLFNQPVTTIGQMSQVLQKSSYAVRAMVRELENLEILSEAAVNKRNKQYHFMPYLAVLEKEYAVEG